MLSAPRSLYAAVNCRFSNFSQTSAPIISDKVRLTIIGVRTTLPLMPHCRRECRRSFEAEASPRGLAVHLAATMLSAVPCASTLLALTAALLPRLHFGHANHQVNGIQVERQESCSISGALIGDDGKVSECSRCRLVRLAEGNTNVDGSGRTLLPGLIDAHGHVIGLGFAALQLDLVGTSSLADLQQRFADLRGRTPHRWFSAAAGIRSCGPTRSSRQRPTSTPSCLIVPWCWTGSTAMRSSQTAPR